MIHRLFSPAGSGQRDLGCRVPCAVCRRLWSSQLSYKRGSEVSTGPAQATVGGVGYSKRLLEEQWERGWSSVGRNVCAEYLSDDALSAEVAGAAECRECDYCGRSSDEGDLVAASVDVDLDAIVEGLRTEYEDPLEEVAWSSADGGFQMPTFDTWDLLENHEVTENVELLTDLAGAIEQQWCQLNVYAPAPHEALRWGWQGFRDHVTHRARYTYYLPTPHAEEHRRYGEIPPEDMPLALLQAVEAGGLARLLPAGSRWIRARVHDADLHPESAKELGSPPQAFAKTNRMSAAGISAFYGASSEEGAIAEVAGYADPGSYATLAIWETARDLPVIDLVNLPEVPSIFDRVRRPLRPAVRFLREFAADVARPARPDDREHLDYVPTQVVAEYLHQLLPHPDGRVMGVLWASSKNFAVTDCVLFVDDGGCVEQVADWHHKREASLGLLPDRLHRLELPLAPGEAS